MRQHPGSTTANLIMIQGGHGTGKTGNLVLTFSRQGKHREFCSDTGKNLLTQGKYLDCDYSYKKYVYFLGGLSLHLNHLIA